MPSGIRPIVRGLMRWVAALGVALGVLVAPAESLIPDVHDRSAPTVVVAAVLEQDVDHGAARSDVTTIAADSAAGRHGPNDGSHDASRHGYDHCAHSHVMGVVHAMVSASDDAVEYSMYAAISEHPTSVVAPPQIRPPIA